MSKIKSKENKFKKMKMTKEEEQKLKAIIKKGKSNYVLTYGFLLWGFAVPTFIILFEKFVFGVEVNYPNNYFFIWIPIGLIMGFWGWKSINEKIRNKNLPLKEQLQKQKKLNWELCGYIFLWLIVYILLFIGFIYWAFS